MGKVSKGDFAAVAGISRSAVSKLISRGKISESDGGIDLENVQVQQYLASRGVRINSPDSEANPTKKTRGKKNLPASPPPVDTLNLENKASLERKKLAAQAQHIELKNAQIEGRLVAREVMIRGVWNPLETFLVRILTDGAKTMSKALHPLGKSGGTREEYEVAIRQELTSLVIPLKESIQRALKLEDV